MVTKTKKIGWDHF